MMISVGVARNQEERRHDGQGDLGVLLVPCSEVVGLPDAKASGNQRASVQEPEHVIGNEEAHLWPQPHRALVLEVLLSVQEHPCDMAPCLRVIVQVALVKQRRVVIVAPRHAQEAEDQDDGGVEVASQMLMGLGQPRMHRLHRRYQQARLEDGQKEPSRQREVHLRVALLAQHPEEGPRVHPPGAHVQRRNGRVVPLQLPPARRVEVPGQHHHAQAGLGASQHADPCLYPVLGEPYVGTLALVVLLVSLIADRQVVQ
mmetsp:Transcript_18541/g.35313  ORF Transcript_18541/g.35313 Transcript_18541/m.35313 type:complete len:257 (+) Transcript_18541:594-1364(+)